MRVGVPMAVGDAGVDVVLLLLLRTEVIEKLREELQRKVFEADRRTKDYERYGGKGIRTHTQIIYAFTCAHVYLCVWAHSCIPPSGSMEQLKHMLVCLAQRQHARHMLRIESHRRVNIRTRSHQG